MTRNLYIVSLLLITYAPASFAVSDVPVFLPMNVIRDHVLRREGDARMALALAHTNRYLRDGIIGDNNGAKLLWLLYLRNDFQDRFPNTPFPPELVPADIAGTLQGTNQFYEAFAQVRQQNPITLAGYGVIMGRLFHPQVHRHVEEVRLVEAHELRTATIYERNGRRITFIGLVVGAGLAVGGGLLIFVSKLEAGIPLVVVGGLGLAATIGFTIWGECRLGPGTDPGDALADIPRERARDAREDIDDIENQLGEDFKKRADRE